MMMMVTMMAETETAGAPHSCAEAVTSIRSEAECVAIDNNLPSNASPPDVIDSDNVNTGAGSDWCDELRL